MARRVSFLLHAPLDMGKAHTKGYGVERVSKLQSTALNTTPKQICVILTKLGKHDAKTLKVLNCELIFDLNRCCHGEELN